MKKICKRCGNQATGAYIDATGFCFCCNINFPRECKIDAPIPATDPVNWKSEKRGIED